MVRARHFGTLIQGRTIDELVVKVYPVVLGRGVPMFGGGFSPTSLALVDSRLLADGTAVLTYARR